MEPEMVVRSLLARVEAKDWDGAADLYDHDAVVEHPMAGGSSPVPRWLRGRDELRQHFHHVGETGFDVTARDIRCQTTGSGELVTEFEYRGSSPSNPAGFAMSCVFVSTVRDGLIVGSRDYQGPLVPL